LAPTNTCKKAKHNKATNTQSSNTHGFHVGASFVHPSIHPSIHSFIHLYIHPSIHSFIHSFFHPSIHSFIHLFIHPSIHPFIHLFIQPSIHSFFHPSIHPSIHSFIHLFVRSFICLAFAHRHSRGYNFEDDSWNDGKIRTYLIRWVFMHSSNGRIGYNGRFRHFLPTLVCELPW